MSIFSKNVHENMRKTGKYAYGRMKNRNLFAKFNYCREKTEKVGKFLENLNFRVAIAKHVQTHCC
jgi:hypothetical protein